MAEACQSAFPTVTEPEILGYLTDVNQIGYSRDIGRSFTLGGRIYHIFGDTFCKNSGGEFVGLVSNTASMVMDKTKPLESSYLCIEENGMVEPLLPLIDEEIRLQQEQPKQRVTLWNFSGVVEVFPGVGLMYEKGVEHKDSDPTHVYHGIGLARITVDSQTGKLCTCRVPGLLFAEDEPRFGSFSTHIEGDYVYLYSLTPEAGQVVLARVEKCLAHCRDAYQHWNGLGWVQGDWSCSVPMFTDLPQGAVFRTAMFGKGRTYVLVGVSKWGDSKIRLGLAERAEGPWDVREVASAKGINYPNDYMYCIYPHEWATEGEDISLMVTWSEHWPGGVVAARLKFQVDDMVAKGPSATDEL
ncbi:MAG: hypothetical protein Q9163_002495 [Psora crenata]